jgi:cobalt/nickel transport system permease protein
MHIPDGFLSTPVWAAFDAVSFPAVGLVARRTQRGLEDTRIPLLGVLGAFVFAAQMINFPLGAGTSGHLVGGTLLAIVLGPAPAAIVMTAILAIQAFVFQDGGIVSLGANIFNMALAGVLAGYLPYRIWGRGTHRSVAIFAGGVLSVLTSACLALSELLVSGVRMPRGVLWGSLGLFLLSALIEGAITVAVVRAIERLNPLWIRRPEGVSSRAIGAIACGAVILSVAGFLIASAAPDGIWKLAGELQLASQSPAWLHAPLADYQFRGLDSPWLRKAAAGFAGVFLIYIACTLAGRGITSARRSLAEKTIAARCAVRDA